MSDCNYLKEVNDQFGHEYGDILLKIVADTLKEEMPEDSPVIRMGGDEFMILGNGIAEEKASELMANIRESLKRKSKEKLPLSLAMGSYTVQSKDFSFEEVCLSLIHISTMPSARPVWRGLCPVWAGKPPFTP